MKKHLSYLPLALFALFIVGYSLGNILRADQDFSEMENKILAQKPALSLGSIASGDYTRKFDTYASDQFLLRNEWITTKSLLESASGKTENNGILYGADNYLFDKRLSLSTEQMDRNLGFLASFRPRVPESAPYFSVVPSSNEILADKLPAHIPLADEKTLREQAHRTAEEAGYIAVDFAPALTAQKENYIYYRTDHHWTTTGAYYAYCEFVKALGMKPVALDSLSSESRQDFYGTYYNKAKRLGTIPDTLLWYDIPIESLTIGEEVHDSLYHVAQFEERDKYAGFLYSNNAVSVIRRQGVLSTEKPSRIVLFKDSYGNSFAPFLTYHFDEVVVVDLRYLATIDQLLADYPADVIYVMYSFNNFTEDTNVVKLAALPPTK